MTDILYSDLMSRISEGTLDTETIYRVTDYENPNLNAPFTNPSPTKWNLIVTALTNNRIDTYVRLEYRDIIETELEYTYANWDYNCTEYDYAYIASAPTGVLNYISDDKGNSIPYDYFNVTLDGTPLIDADSVFVSIARCSYGDTCYIPAVKVMNGCSHIKIDSIVVFDRTIISTIDHSRYVRFKAISEAFNVTDSSYIEIGEKCRNITLFEAGMCTIGNLNKDVVIRTSQNINLGGNNTDVLIEETVNVLVGDYNEEISAYNVENSTVLHLNNKISLTNCDEIRIGRECADITLNLNSRMRIDHSSYLSIATNIKDLIINNSQDVTVSQSNIEIEGIYDADLNTGNIEENSKISVINQQKIINDPYRISYYLDDDNVRHRIDHQPIFDAPEDGRKYVRQNGEWVQGSGGGTEYYAGENINISDENVISAVDTTYSAGENITIDSSNRISAKGYRYDSSRNFIFDTSTTSTGSGITNSLLAGEGNSGTGNDMFISGSGNDVEGSYSICCGQNNVVNGISGFVSGRNNELSSSRYNNVSGAENKVYSSASTTTGMNVVGGYQCEVHGSANIVVGTRCVAGSDTTNNARAAVFGYQNQALDENGTASFNSLLTGQNNISRHNSAVVFGTRNESSATNQTVVGKYNAVADSSHSLFVVGNGTSTSARKNAFTVNDDNTITVNGHKLSFITVKDASGNTKHVLGY